MRRGDFITLIGGAVATWAALPGTALATACVQLICITRADSTSLARPAAPSHSLGLRDAPAGDVWGGVRPGLRDGRGLCASPAAKDCTREVLTLSELTAGLPRWMGRQGTSVGIFWSPHQPTDEECDPRP